MINQLLSKLSSGKALSTSAVERTYHVHRLNIISWAALLSVRKLQMLSLRCTPHSIQIMLHKETDTSSCITGAISLMNGNGTRSFEYTNSAWYVHLFYKWQDFFDRNSSHYKPLFLLWCYYCSLIVSNVKDIKTL